MKLRNNVLFDEKFYAALLRLSKLDLDLKDSIPLAKTIKCLREEAATIFPIRDRIFGTYGIDKVKVDTSGLTDEQKSEFNNKIRELVETEFEVPLSQKIVLDPQQIKGKLSANDLLAITDIVEY